MRIPLLIIGLFSIVVVSVPVMAEIPVIYSDLVQASTDLLTQAQSHLLKGDRIKADNLFMSALSRASQSNDPEAVQRAITAHFEAYESQANHDHLKWSEKWDNPDSLASMLPFLEWKMELQVEAERLHGTVRRAEKIAASSGNEELRKRVEKVRALADDAYKKSLNPLVWKDQRQDLRERTVRTI